jgi:DNA helicase-2/ATP-dependent DNA helicase PcrA
VLVPRNERGKDVVNRLIEHKLEFVEYLGSSAPTRAAAGALGNVTTYLADPISSIKLAKVYEVWRRDWREDAGQKLLYTHIPELIRKCTNVETFLAPRPGQDWLDTLVDGEPAPVLEELSDFRKIAQRWLGTALLPVDQMILTLAQDLFTEPADLALAHKLALVLRQVAQDHADWRLPELTRELVVVAKNERKFLGFSSDDSGFDPSKHKGKVVVSTMHKAKGLEWDRVYLMSVNNYDFPSGDVNDSFIAEKWFVQGKLNLEAEALAQLRNALARSEYDWQPEGEATLRARNDYIRERLRLLYVGITRAKRDLIMTWNTGRNGGTKMNLAMAALVGWQEDSP